MKSVTVRSVFRENGKIHFVKANKQGYSFSSVQQALDILEAAENAIGDEVLLVAAARKVGIPNLQTLEGKTITLRMELEIT